MKQYNVEITSLALDDMNSIYDYIAQYKTSIGAQLLTAPFRRLGSKKTPYLNAERSLR